MSYRHIFSISKTKSLKFRKNDKKRVLKFYSKFQKRKKWKIEKRVLWLDHNEIRSLPDDIFYECENIEQINLAANQLEYVQHFLFADLEHLEQLFLQDNELRFIFGFLILISEFNLNEGLNKVWTILNTVFI